MEKMVKAIFLDFYGTVVFEDGEIVAKISQTLYEPGNAESVGEIGSYWWNRLRHYSRMLMGKTSERREIWKFSR